MTINIDIRATPTHLHVTLDGQYTLHDLKTALTRVRQGVDDYQSTKLLVDCRGVTGDPSLRERFEIVAFVLQQRINAILHGKPVNVPTAIVGARPLLHPGRYGIRLLAERGLRLMICEDMAEALAWLGLEAQPQHPVA
ncbi:MAG TPA: STAS/SEC14 domain-containing protein [Alphaproteobacteria bacterium]|nr:STAS/SEC14 domain-containing protein [Alphaproteobacteria bacterium]